MHLYPRLRLVTASALAAELADLSVDVAAARSGLEHPEASPAPTGGQATTGAELAALQSAVRTEASNAGYPSPPSLTGQQDFDARVSRLLLHQMDIAPSEAAHPEVWAFLGCVLLPDVVRWRFAGTNGTTAERFIGGARGMRNALGRLWWRAFLLETRAGPTGHVDPVVGLNEDELVQITERPGLSGYPPLASELAHAFLKLVAQSPSVPREALMRQTAKRLLRMLALVVPETMEQDEVEALIKESLGRAREALQAGAIASSATNGATHTAERGDSTRARRVQGRQSALASGVRTVLDAVSAGARQVLQGSPSPQEPLLELLDAEGLEVIDRRARGGRLWVVGGTELEELLTSAAPSGNQFVFARGGSDSTSRRPGWYLFERKS